MTVRLDGLRIGLGGRCIIDDLSLEVPRGELTALLGPSGCGKTTLLRAIAGLESPEAGRVHIDDVDVTALPPEQRRVGFVFQHYALFRHMSVFENVAFGLRVRPRHARASEAAVSARVAELLGLLGLAELAARLPHQLSGGQRQRVALARALAVEPRVLLLDEPFSALDARVRKDLRRWLRELHERIGLTTVIVTHDQDEALELADRVVIMNAGRLEQGGPPEAVYAAPATRFVREFLGGVNEFEDAQGRLPLRPHEVQLLAEPRGPFAIPARLVRYRTLGRLCLVDLRGESPPHRFFRVELPAGSEPGLPGLGALVWLEPGVTQSPHVLTPLDGRRAAVSAPDAAAAFSSRR